MSGSTQRVMDAFAHRAPDRTPLFEIFQDGQPIHWPICGRTIATDQAMQWDAYADGVSQAEMIDARAKAVFAITRHFGLDMLRIPADPPSSMGKIEKTGPTSWRRDGVDYVQHPRTKMVVLANPADTDSYTHRYSEDDVRRQVESWDGTAPPAGPEAPFAVWRRVRAMAEAERLDWVYLAEIGGGTGVAFFPPFQLMWFALEPELLHRWVTMHSAAVMRRMRQLIAAGAGVVAMGGDVSCDKGPFCSPQHYREFILPAVQEQVRCIHDAGGLAVYTSDGNHWPIARELFFESGVDGYKEVDYAAGMTMDRLIAEGVKDRLCIVGNMDARHTFCHGTSQGVRDHVRRCLELGCQSPGGHILHMSHSVHEDVKPENYLTAIETYREFFGL